MKRLIFIIAFALVALTGAAQIDVSMMSFARQTVKLDSVQLPVTVVMQEKNYYSYDNVPCGDSRRNTYVAASASCDMPDPIPSR